MEGKKTIGLDIEFEIGRGPGYPAVGPAFIRNGVKRCCPLLQH